jgi:hypothetical protein
MIRAIFLAIVLAGAPAPERVRIEADEIGIMKKDKLEAIAIEATKLAEEAGIAPHEMSVSLVWQNRTDLVYGIRVRIETSEAKLVDPDDLRGPVVHRCPRCNESDLVTASIEGVLEALGRYEEAKAPPPAPKQAAEPIVTAPPPGEDARPTDRGYGFGPMGQIGVASIVVGGAVAITGAAFIGVGTTRPELDPTQLRNWRPPGYALLGVGAAVLVTGVALLVVDRKRGRGLAISPMMAPRLAGVVAEGKF